MIVTHSSTKRYLTKVKLGVMRMDGAFLLKLVNRKSRGIYRSKNLTEEEYKIDLVDKKNMRFFGIVLCVRYFGPL